jgi:transcriptional regulator with XRE-family HTH domain
MQTFGEMMRQRREALGLSQNRLAKLSETQQAVVNYVEAGSISPPPGSVEKWANFFNLSGGDLDDWWYAATIARLRSDPRTEPFVQRLEARFRSLEGMVSRLLDLYIKSGRQVPDDILKSAESFGHRAS